MYTDEIPAVAALVLTGVPNTTPPPDRYARGSICSIAADNLRRFLRANDDCLDGEALLTVFPPQLGYLLRHCKFESIPQSLSMPDPEPPTSPAPAVIVCPMLRT